MVNSFLCPSDPNIGRFSTNSYSFCIGVSSGVGGFTGPTNGLFGVYYAPGIQEATDGTSNTIAMAEHLSGDNQGSGRIGQSNSPSRYRGNGVQGTGGQWETGRVLDNTVSVNGQRVLSPVARERLERCRTTWLKPNPNASIVDHRGFRWNMGVTGYTLFNTVETPNPAFNYCRNGCSKNCNMDNSTSTPASSAHPGGVNVCMADGSVKFMKSTVSTQVWWALGSKDGGEVLSADSY